jgi:hypothetical protein
MSPFDFRGDTREPYSAGQRPPWQDRLQEAAQRIEDDVRNLVTYMNDVVVPDVRKHGSEALRVAAQELHKLAEHLDRQSNTPPPPPGPPKP